MQHALVNNQLTPAAPGAPATAACPHCGGLVALRARKGTHFWRHVELPREGCPPPNPGPEAGDDPALQTRRVGDFIIEGDLRASCGPSLRLRSLSAEGAGEPSELAIPLRQARHLAAALLDAAAELLALSPVPPTGRGPRPGSGQGGTKGGVEGTAAEAARLTQGLNDDDEVPLRQDPGGDV